MPLKLFYEIEAKVYEIKAQVSHEYELIWCFTLYRNGNDTSKLHTLHLQVSDFIWRNRFEKVYVFAEEVVT